MKKSVTSFFSHYFLLMTSLEDETVTGVFALRLRVGELQNADSLLVTVH